MICDRCGGRLYGADVIARATVCVECERRLCRKPDEWAVFVAALKSSVRSDGTVHQSDVRPKIRGRIQPKHVGQLWRRAMRDGLISRAGYEESDDEKGRNAGRMEPYYSWEKAS